MNQKIVNKKVLTENDIVGNKKYILNTLGFKSINAAKKKYNLRRNEIENIAMYKLLLINYNDDVREFNRKNLQKILRAKKRKEKRKTIGLFNKLTNYVVKQEVKKEKSNPFKLLLTIETIYKKDNKKYITKKLIGTFTDKTKIMDHIKNELNEDGYKAIKVKKFFVIDQKPQKPNIAQHKHLLKKAFVLQNDWLKYSKDIASYAYDDAGGQCVPYQLAKYLLNPPSGRPTKKIDGMKVNQENIGKFIWGNHTQEQLDAYEELLGMKFDVNDGISTEMIGDLCKCIKRNMYAYDYDDKCFYKVNQFDSKNYCPIVFYKMNGHIYIINSKKAIKSISESNRQVKSIITSSIDDDIKKKEEKVEVFHINTFLVKDALQMKSGTHIIQKSSLLDEVISFYQIHKTTPKTKSKNGMVNGIRFFNEDGKEVEVCCDANYSHNIFYDDLNDVCNINNIPYTNQGIGYVIKGILENSLKGSRGSVNREHVYETSKHICNLCGIQVSINQYEIDHIKPVSCGGNSDESNLQVLCLDCHKTKKKEERDLGLYNTFNNTESCFNSFVLNNVVNTNEFKFNQFVETIQDDDKTLTPYKLDMRKCRRNIAFHSQYEFPVYSVMDKPVEFKGDLKCGMFYVNTENGYPFRGCGWYSYPLVDYGIKNCIILAQDILLEFIPSKSVSNTYFQPIIETLLKGFETQPSLTKLSFNSYIGLLGKTKFSNCYSKFTSCPYEASNMLCNDDYDVFIKNHMIGYNEVLYEAIHSKQVITETSSYPIYSQIVQMEAIELHKLETQIKSKGGVIYDRNTDAIRYGRHSKIDLTNKYYDIEKTIQKYQDEEPKPLICSKLSNYKREHTLDVDKFKLRWKEVYDIEDIDEIIRIGSLHIDGRAGCGKTYITNKVIDRLREQGKNIYSLSPTNKGARLINGQTIHSIYYKFKKNKKMLLYTFKVIDYVFIDEVSMMTEMFYRLFIMIKRALPHLNFILVGDYEQLPPVKDTWNGNYKYSIGLHELVNGNRLILTKCKRTDDKLYEICLDVDKVDVGMFPYMKPTYKNIAYTHKTRIQINKDCMARYISEHNGQCIHITMDMGNPKTQDVVLMKGMPIISHKTNSKLEICNTDTFNIINVDTQTITFVNDVTKKQIKTTEFHKYFYVGFCQTIHSSQGETFNEKYTIHDWNMKSFNKELKYVALSRGTNLNNIQIQI